jgi:16S rRNA (adenine1518-N6/adenine1519-N6)-dimethyltransferase
VNKQELLRLLERLDIRPSVRMGQNFLVDPNLRDALVRDASPQPGETLLEVGPGTGMLTESLLDAGARVVAVELDRRLCEYLRERFGQNERFELIEGDACRLDYGSLMAGGSYRLVANLPYSAGTILIGKLLDLDAPPTEVYVLLQREVAERLTAAPGGKTYNALSVRAQTLYDTRLLRTVPGRVFYPEPEVASCHVRMVRLAAPPARRLRGALATVARAAFSQRRKKLLRVLQNALPQTDWPSAFERLSLSPDARAETLSRDQFLSLATTHLQTAPK